MPPALKPELRLTRVPMPSWVTRPGFGVAGYDELGGQMEWHFATPWVFRALASPSTSEPVLAAPQHSDPHEHLRAYWASLLYVLMYRLGWAHPERGLAWWAAAGFPDVDPTLRLVRKVWVNDGQLKKLHGWLAQSQTSFAEPFAETCGYVASGPPLPESPAGQILRAATAFEVGPLGPAELHLEGAGHLMGPVQDAGSGVLVRSEPSQRRAVLITSTMAGWYADLAALGGKLPDLGDRSWHVDVVATPVGHLGRFRRSRVTGLWFTGTHSTHIAGT